MPQKEIKEKIIEILGGLKIQWDKNGEWEENLPPYDSCKCEEVAGDNEFCLIHRNKS